MTLSSLRVGRCADLVYPLLQNPWKADVRDEKARAWRDHDSHRLVSKLELERWRKGGKWYKVASAGWWLAVHGPGLMVGVWRSPLCLVLTVWPRWPCSRGVSFGAFPGGKSIRAPGGRDGPCSHSAICWSVLLRSDGTTDSKSSARVSFQSARTWFSKDGKFWFENQILPTKQKWRIFLKKGAESIK